MSQPPPRDAVKRAREERWGELMRAAQNGDQVAYAKLLGDLLPPLRKLVLRKWRDPGGVEDVVQEILISIHSVRHTYDPDRPFAPWLMTIAQRRIMDAARKTYGRARFETTVDMMPETFFDDDTKTDQQVSDDHDELRHALDSLSENHRQAVELTKLQGLSLEEASRVSGKSVSSLKVSVHRALKEMRKALERKQ